MTVAGSSGASPAHPSSTALVEHSQTHSELAVRAILHLGPAQQSQRTLWDVPEDGPHNTSTYLGLDFRQVPLLPLSVRPKRGRQQGTWR